MCVGVCVCVCVYACMRACGCVCVQITHINVIFYSINTTLIYTVQDYEKTLEEYSMSPADLEDQFTRMASITYAHNTKRPTSSAGELGRNILAQDVLKLRHRYDKLLSALEKK